MALLRKTNRLQLNVRKSVKHQKHGGRATPSHGSQPATARQHSVRSQTTYNKLLSAYIRGLFSCWLAGCEVTERLGLQSASLANPYFVILPSSDRFPFNWLLCRCSPTSAWLPVCASDHLLPPQLDIVRTKSSGSVHLFNAWPIIWRVLSMHLRKMLRNDMLSKAACSHVRDGSQNERQKPYSDSVPFKCRDFPWLFSSTRSLVPLWFPCVCENSRFSSEFWRLRGTLEST